MEQNFNIDIEEMDNQSTYYSYKGSSTSNTSCGNLRSKSKTTSSTTDTNSRSDVKSRGCKIWSKTISKWGVIFVVTACIIGAMIYWIVSDNESPAFESIETTTTPTFEISTETTTNTETTTSTEATAEGTTTTESFPF